MFECFQKLLFSHLFSHFMIISLRFVKIEIYKKIILSYRLLIDSNKTNTIHTNISKEF